MEQTFAVQAGFEHEAELVTGYVDLLDCKEQEIELTPAAVYTEAVLDMENSDLQVVDGQEGFLDSIKRGAAKIYEWIKSIIRSIRNWFSKGSKDYNESKKEIQNVADEPITEHIKDIAKKSVEEFVGPEFKEVLRKAPREEKVIIETKAKEIASEIAEKPEVIEKITGTVINEIASKVAVRINKINTKAKEIKRIDPTGETLTKLGLSSDWNAINDSTKNTEKYFNKEDQVGFSRRVKKLVEHSEEAQKELSIATSALDKWNESSRGDDSQARALSRAAAVLKELTEIASIFRDTIISINSQLMIGYKTAEKMVIKDIISQSIDDTRSATSDYMLKAFEEMGPLTI